MMRALRDPMAMYGEGVVGAAGDRVCGESSFRSFPLSRQPSSVRRMQVVRQMFIPALEVSGRGIEGKAALGTWRKKRKSAAKD